MFKFRIVCTACRQIVLPAQGDKWHFVNNPDTRNWELDMADTWHVIKPGIKVGEHKFVMITEFEVS